MRTEIKDKINSFVDHILEWSQEDRLNFVKKLCSVCDYDYERYAIIMFYVYGLRPIELMQITKDRFKIEGDIIRVRLPTAKGGQLRIIDLSISLTPFMDFIADYINTSPSLLPTTWTHTTNINHIFKKISKRLNDPIVEPYMFRKFRLSFLAIELDASAVDLQTWKGSTDMNSIKPYLRMRPVKKYSGLIR